MSIRLVKNGSVQNTADKSSGESLDHHFSLINSYLNSHRIRNHAPSTVEKEKRFLMKWFLSFGYDGIPLFTWSAMNGIEGKKILKDYQLGLLESGLHPKTIRGHLSILRKYFSFVLDFPIATSSNNSVRIDDFYGVQLIQPISEFDIPLHTYDGEDRGIPIDPGKLYDFYSVVRKFYLNSDDQYLAFRSRSYTMAVIAGESGLRISEIINLSLEDLFFESGKIQTRYAKGSRGSGKKARVSLFTPFAQDTVKYFLKTCRKRIFPDKNCKLLFPSQTGKKISYQICQRDLGKMVKLAISKGMPVQDHLTWHWLRRIFATRFIENNPGKLSVLVKLLGHSSPNTVHRYIRHSDAWIDDEITKTLEEYAR